MKTNTIARYILILAAAAMCAGTAAAGRKANSEKPRVYVNPGHGGHDDDDRYEPFYNQAAHDTVDYYESDSNLGVGNALVDLLRKKGYDVYTSRVNNGTYDDLDLFEICQLAEDSGADMFFCIHSNDTGTDARVNFPLALYHGWTGKPVSAGSDSIASYVMRRLYASKATCWSREPMISGDWTFYPQWGYRTGLGVLRYNKLPGMLSEAVYHDYLPERERLLNKDYNWLEGWLHSLAIDEYFGRLGNYGKGSISGIVRYNQLRVDSAMTKTYGDDAYQPVSGAVVRLFDANGKELRTYTTDHLNNGYYLFGDLRPGEYVIKVDGIAQRASKVNVRANAPSYCNIFF